MQANAHELDRFRWSVEIYCHADPFWLTSSWIGFFFLRENSNWQFNRNKWWKNEIISAFDLIYYTLQLCTLFYPFSDSNQPKLHICTMRCVSFMHFHRVLSYNFTFFPFRNGSSWAICWIHLHKNESIDHRKMKSCFCFDGTRIL